MNFLIGGDGIGTRGNPGTGHNATGEERAGDRTLAGVGQRQNGGSDHASGSNEWAHHGRSFAPRGHSASDRGDEHARRRFHA